MIPETARVANETGANLTDWAISLVLSERMRQNAKWGDQSGHPLFTWLAILGEEMGELCEACLETELPGGAHPERGGLRRVRDEAIHVAAVATAIIETVIRKEEGSS